MIARGTWRSSAALVSLAAFLLQTAPWPVLHAWHMAPSRGAVAASCTHESGVLSADRCAAEIGVRHPADERGAGCAICTAAIQNRSAVPTSTTSGEPACAAGSTSIHAPFGYVPSVEAAAAAARAPPSSFS